MITLSEDSHIRLSYPLLQEISFLHLLSGLDSHCLDPYEEESFCSDISGYTEWISVIKPVITIGWDWKLTIENSNVFYERSSLPRSNIMLQDAHHHDLGSACSAEFIGLLIDGMDWPEKLHEAISDKYSYKLPDKPDSYKFTRSLM